MATATVALVGRPNVGKSSLFNRLSGRRLAITDSAEGTTRDRLFCHIDLFGTPIDLIDTGGIAPHGSDDPFAQEIEAAAEAAIEEADGLVLVVDGETGPLKEDLALARRLQKLGKPLALAVNKIDERKKEHLVHAFHRLGIELIEGVSALHGRGAADLLERLLKALPQKAPTEKSLSTHAISIIGTPNVGKSTLINTLSNSKRCAVSPLAGTTRDSVDLDITFDETCYRFIDTAGVRRKGAEKAVVDKFAALRTERAINRSDICCVMIDATRGLCAQEKKIFSQIEKAGKSCILLLNKWDLIHDERQEHKIRELRESAPGLEHCPIIVLSALTGRGTEKLFPAIDSALESRSKRITTGELNRFFEEAMALNPPAMIQGKRLRIYYATQVSSAPPSFTLFINYPKLLMPSYKRYLTKQLRERFAFAGAPIRIFLKGKKAEERTRKKSDFKTIGENRVLTNK